MERIITFGLFTSCWPLLYYHGLKGSGSWEQLEGSSLLGFALVCPVSLFYLFAELVSGQVLNGAVFFVRRFCGLLRIRLYLQRVKLRSSILYGLVICAGFVWNCIWRLADELSLKCSYA